MKSRIIMSLILLVVSSSFGITRYVPNGGSPSHATIQDAIDAASDGDVVLVSNGYYTAAGFHTFMYFGKAITVKSAFGPENCILNCGDQPGGISFSSNETHDSVLDGFTIKAGSRFINNSGNSNWNGGGINIYNSSPTIKNCIIEDFKAEIGVNYIGGVYGGGVSIYGDASPVIENCIIRDCFVKDSGLSEEEYGGGISVTGNASLTLLNTKIEGCEPDAMYVLSTGSVAIDSSVFSGNSVSNKFFPALRLESSNVLLSNSLFYDNQKGLKCEGGDPVVKNCVFANNSSTAIYCIDSSPTLSNLTIVSNYTGIAAAANSSPYIYNCILWSNNYDLSNAWASYSCIEDGDAGEGNISIDPQFVDSVNGDYHLKSLVGRWDEVSESWTVDDIASSCIDAGNLTSDYSLEPVPNGTRVNMGAYGATAFASKSGPPLSLTVDSPNGGETIVAGSMVEISWSGHISGADVVVEYSFNNGSTWEHVSPTNIGNTGSYSWSVPTVISNDCLVRVKDSQDDGIADVSDFTFEIYQCSIIGDLTGDCFVNLQDLAILAQNWLQYGDMIIYKNSLMTNPNWSIEGEWTFGVPQGLGGTGQGNSDPNSGFTDNNVYGVNLAGDYAVALATPYYLTAGPFDCSTFNDVKVSFQRWLNSDETGYIENTLDISIDGIVWQRVWDNSTDGIITDAVWHFVEYEIHQASNQPAVYLRWGYEVTSDRAYPYSGWNIDDVALWGIK